MPLSSPFQRTALATVLALVAAATIVTFDPATGAPAPAAQARTPPAARTATV